MPAEYDAQEREKESMQAGLNPIGKGGGATMQAGI